jgi:hypothetical protein
VARRLDLTETQKLVQECLSVPGRVKLLVPRFHVAPALID